MPKVPKQVRIGHMTLGITYDDIECDGMGSNGHVQLDARQISIRSTLVPEKEREVVLHELLHAVMGVSNLVWEDDAAEERIVASMTGPLLDLLQRNRPLVNYLLNQE